MQNSEVSLKVTTNRFVQLLDSLYTFMVLVPCTGSPNFKQLPLNQLKSPSTTVLVLALKY